MRVTGSNRIHTSRVSELGAQSLGGQWLAAEAAAEIPGECWAGLESRDAWGTRGQHQGEIGGCGCEAPERGWIVTGSYNQFGFIMGCADSDWRYWQALKGTSYGTAATG
ncbi:hypothetical protein NDU88_001531 [Pleurodeles waltl]|uniref:Uncharacterized protein n=1 Tax=Pleurodeles waltl TaxID=8319 RepID=A0AAV7MJZ8_PLEWA|nr:hypothetical protein NDU88_001531 [Pleurodeles waltl]